MVSRSALPILIGWGAFFDGRRIRGVRDEPERQRGMMRRIGSVLQRQMIASRNACSSASALRAPPRFRSRTIGGSPDPRHTPVFEAGGGITPYIGLRFGASFARGAYLTGSEITDGGADDRMATMAGFEAE